VSVAPEVPTLPEDALSILLGSGEAARRIGISVVYLSRLAQDGRINFLQSPNGRLYWPHDVQALAERRQAKRGGPG
jgi:predicted site-specific integrase-resolvase